MATTPIGPIYYDDARTAVMRDPVDLDTTYAVVRSAINIRIDTNADGQKIIDAWTEIMQATADKIAEVLSE